jgi:hypothetical protein
VSGARVVTSAVMRRDSLSTVVWVSVLVWFLVDDVETNEVSGMSNDAVLSLII